MALKQQSYLPVMYEGMVRAAFVIAPTLFTGAETDFTIGNAVYPMQRITYKYVKNDAWNDLTDEPVDFMGIVLDASDDRMTYADNVMWLGDLVEGIHQWKCLQGINRYDVTYGNLMLMLNAKGAWSANTPSPGVPAISVTNASMNWNVNADMSMAPKFSFLDFNWVDALKATSGNLSPAKITIGTPSADPGSGLHIKLMVTQSAPEVINNGLLFSTLRFVKITAGQATAGTYVWPITITNTDGSTDTATMTLVVA